MRNTYRILVGIPEEKKPRRRWEDNFEMYLKGIRREGVDGSNWIGLGSSGGLF
jgi:hypothetical protein